ncbi:MAG: signal recognition particle-docking protein FtsY [Gammaproteobacteria bacterium]
MGIREGLRRTRERLGTRLARLARGTRKPSEEQIGEIEALLLAADVGVEATERIVAGLRGQLRRRDLESAEAFYAALRARLFESLAPLAQPLSIPRRTRPFVILMLGVNGSGKTTTIGKLAARLVQEGRTVAVAAADTFRAAAIEQLQHWGQRAGVPVTSKAQGADPAAVAFEALEAASARRTEVLIVDTAGRLNTQIGLMQQLSKIARALGKIDAEAPHERLLVIDATVGQNALNQARDFNAAVPLTGLVLTKLDGTAKGGMVFSLAEEMRVPLRFIGLGECVEDLQPFDAAAFIDSLLAEDPQAS